MKYTHNGGVAQGLSRTSIIALAVGFALTLALSVFSIVRAIAYVPPSTNDINRTNGWAHVNQLSQSVGETELEFVSTRAFPSCFEYRTDGDTSQVVATNGGVNYNAGITDGLYPYTCESNSTSTMTLEADEYVEVRMVFGGEDDERFDWTRFDVLYPVTGEILSPLAGEVVSGSVNLLATYDDGDTTDTDEIFWAVRSATCDVNAAANVAGNVTGVNDPYAWDNENFSATIDVSGWADGDYCFIFNPNAGDDDVRETREFVVDNTAPGQVDGVTVLQNSVDIGCSAFVTERLITVDWNDSTDPNFDYYGYQADDGVGSIDFTTTVAASERTGQIRDTDGTYQYRVRAVDTAGNVGEWSDWCMVTLDREAPVVSIDEPLDGAVLSGTVDIVGDVTDNLDLSHYNLSLYPSTTDLSDGGTHSGDRLNDANWCTTPTDGTVNLTASIVDTLLCDDWDTTYLADGDYQIRLAARDASGLRDLSDPFNAGTSSVHVIDITIANEVEEEEGNTLGAVTDGNEDDGREVLGENTENGEVLDSHNTLSETGHPAILTTLISLLAITLALGATRFSRR